MPGSGSDFIRRAGGVYGVALLFNILLGIHSWFPDYRWLMLLVPVPEALFFTWLTEKGRRVLPPVSLLLPLFTALSAGEAFFRYVYKRPLDPIANLPLASRFTAMLLQRSDISSALFMSGAALLYLLLSLLLFLLLRLISVPPAANCRRDSFLFLTLFLISVVLSPLPPALRTAGTVIKNSVCRTAPEEPVMEHEEGSLDEGAERREPDIHLFIVESYGMTVFTNEDHRKRILPFLKEEGRVLLDKGFGIASSAYLSTTFGGTSWLADATILSGIRIDTQEKYQRVIEASSRNIIHRLKEKGYTTVLSAPGTSFMTEKYIGFYAYDHLFLHDDFGYEGPYFTYGTMPDQYHLYRVQRDLLSGLGGEVPTGEAPPLFVEYILCSSHVPWNYIPPYIGSWEGFDNGKLYFDRSRNSWYDNSWVSGSELFEGYDHSIRYSLETVAGFITTYIDPEDIAVIIGDHQPKFPVSERGADFSVPVHIVSGDEDIIGGFLEQGYGPGLIPPEQENRPSLEQFLPDFLKAVFGGSGESGE